jgi:GxxExxY protein
MVKLTDDFKVSYLFNELLAALHRVHFELGSGFLHQIYRRAAMVQLKEQEIGYEYIKEIPIFYQNHHLIKQIYAHTHVIQSLPGRGLSDKAGRNRPV